MFQDNLRTGVMAVLALAPAVAAADELSLGLRASAGYSDNVYRTSSNEESSALYAPGFDIAYAEKSAGLDARALGTLDYLIYSADNLDSRLIGTFDGSAAIGIVPETFVWNVTESYGQGLADAFQAATPENTQGINYFATGPQLRVDFSQRMFVIANAVYANSWYENQDGDSNQYGAGVSLGRALSEASSLRLSAQYLKTNYTNGSFAPDYDTWEYFGAYMVEGARTNLDLDLGYRSFDNGTKTQGGPLVRFSLSRLLSAYTTIYAIAGDEYSDAASQLNGDLSMPGNPGATTGGANGQVFVDTYGGLGIAFNRLRTRFGGSVTYHDENYVETSLNDLHRWDVSGYLQRDFTPRLTGGLDVTYYDESYTKVDYSDSQVDWSLYLDWQFARTVGATLEWARWGASNTGSPDAHENQYWLRFTWKAIDHRSPGMPATPGLSPLSPPPPGS
ncbi:MAG: hypothetical protein U1F08_06255 [Steroidobacteraceae bacterium]